MNVFGIDILQLIVYGCVFACVIIVVYILKLQRSKKKTEPAENEPEQLLSEDKTIIKQLIILIDKMYSHQVGLTQTSTSNPNPEPETPTEKKPEPQAQKKSPARLSKVDEETYMPTEQDNELLERLKERLKAKKSKIYSKKKRKGGMIKDGLERTA